MQDECAHEWLDRPESDTFECLLCGVEGSGFPPGGGPWQPGEDADCPKCGRFICDDRATCEGLRSRPAAAGEPVEAVATDGIVMILVDSTTARQLAAAWKFAHGRGALDSADRPTYPLDVAAILRAAIDADKQASVELADVRYVPLLRVVDAETYHEAPTPAGAGQDHR